MLEYKRAVPFTMFTGGVGRHAQGKLPIAKDYMGDPSSKTVRGGSVPDWTAGEKQKERNRLHAG